MPEKILSVLKSLIAFDFGFNISDEERNYSVRVYEGEDVWVAAVSYIPFVSAAVLLLRKNNSEFILDHSKQALILVLLVLLTTMILSSILRLIILVILVFLIILSTYKAVSGKKFYIPLVTQLARLVEI